MKKLHRKLNIEFYVSEGNKQSHSIHNARAGFILQKNINTRFYTAKAANRCSFQASVCLWVRKHTIDKETQPHCLI